MCLIDNSLWRNKNKLQYIKQKQEKKILDTW